MVAIQLDFFKIEREIRLEGIEKLIEKVEQQSSNVRKGIFARHNVLQKKYDELSERLNIIEKNLCCEYIPKPVQKKRKTNPLQIEMQI